jgi:hypothetical protein
MRTTAARVALVLLAFTTSFAFGEIVRAPSAGVERGTAAIGTGVADDVHAIVAVPVRSTDWAVNEQRSPHRGDGLVAILLAAAVVLVAQLWRRAAVGTSRDRACLCSSHGGIRGPPAPAFA